MKVAVSQSNYLPWRGYFDMIASVDVFVLLDDVQFTRRDWRNRNRIKTPNGLSWLTIPVESKGKYEAKIAEIEVPDDGWKDQHLKTLSHAYSRSDHAKEILGWLAGVYGDSRSAKLHEINQHFIERINAFLGIDTILVSSLDFSTPSEPNERLMSICRELGATNYVTGPAARDYLQEESFNAEGIAVEWFDYGPYLPYRQPWGDYEERVSVIDLLLNCGVNAKNVYRGRGL